MKYVWGILITVLVGFLFLVGFNTYITNSFDQRVDDIIHEDNYTLEVLYLTKHPEDGGSLKRTITVKKDKDTYSIVNDSANYYHTSFVVPNETQYEAYLKTSREGDYVKVTYPYEPERYLNILDFSIQDINSSMFNHASGVYRLDSKFFPSIFEEEVESFTATIEKDSMIFELDSLSKGFIKYHFKDVGTTEITLPDLSQADVYEPYTTWITLPETHDAYLSAVSDFHRIDNIHTIEVDTEGQYIIWAESDLYLRGQLWSDQQMNGTIIGTRGPEYNFSMIVELEPGIQYNLTVTEYTSLFHGTYDIFVVLVDEDE